MRHAGAAFAVSGIAPGCERITPHKPRNAVDRYVGPIGQRCDAGAHRSFRAAVQTLGVQHRIDFIDAGDASKARFPQRAKALIIGVSTLRARTMAGGERRRFIQEEKFGVRARLHNRTMPPAELDQAGNPALHLGLSHDAAAIIVQDAAIAHHQPAPRQGEDLAVRRDAVLQRHRSLQKRFMIRGYADVFALIFMEALRAYCNRFSVGS